MLLERDHQLAALNDRLEAASIGAGSLVLVGGEAGAGKTSLVREFIDRLGSRAVVGACDPLSTPRPLSPLRDFIDLHDDANIDLFREVLERFGRSVTPTVMVLEDIHWADQATLDFVRYVGRRVGERKLVVLCTYRDDEIGIDHPLRAVLGQLSTLPSTVRVSVPMLTIEAVRTLTTSTPLDPGELHRLTGGNAFFVTEVVAAGGSPPDSLNDAVLARLVDLEPAVRRVIETVSIAPRSLDMRRTLALGSLADDIDAAVGRGVIQAEGDQLRFRHELARSAVESAIPPARRHELHRAMLVLLTDEVDPDHARLAHHAVAAHSPELIVEHAPTAARHAVARGSSREATALFRAALDHAADDWADEAAGLRLELAVELTKLDRPAEALVELELAHRHYVSTGAALAEVAALRHMGRAHGALGRSHEAMRCAREAVELAEPHGPSEGLVLALNGLAGRAMLARRAREGLPHAERAAAMAQSLGLDRALLEVQHMQACLELLLGDTDLGIELLRRSAEEADLSIGSRVLAHVNLGSGAGEVRRYETAIDALVEAEALGVANDIDVNVAYSRAWLARVAFEQGRWDDAVAYAALVDATVTNRDGDALLTARGVLGRVRVRRGDPGGDAVLQETLAGFHGHELQYRWSPAAGMAEHHWLRGDRRAMAEVLVGPYEEALETDSEWARGELGYWMWKAGEIDAPPSRAAAPFAAQIAGEPDRAVELWEQIGSPYEAALARSEGPPELAVDALGALDALGAAPLADRVRAELRASGVDRVPRGPHPATQAHPFGLTGRQAEVLDLVVEGLSNAEIADRLYLSKKTVEHHVSAVYAKLGVQRRAQAIAAVRPSTAE